MRDGENIIKGKITEFKEFNKDIDKLDEFYSHSYDLYYEYFINMKKNDE